MDASAGRGQPFAALLGAVGPTRRLLRALELHARRADAGDGAPLLRLLGLPDHRLLRADQPLRHAAGPDEAGRPAPPARHRRDPGLGALAVPDRRARPGELRRHPPLRARRPTAGLPPGVEELHLQPGSPRGPELPDLERPLLARSLSRRW